MKETDKTSAMKKWLIAVRPFAFPASAMPVIFGTALAVVTGGASFNAVNFFLAISAMMILHAGANMLNDAADFRSGLDVMPTPVSGALVRSLLSDRAVQRAGIICFIAGSLIGLYLVYVTGPALFAIGACGLLIGLMYSNAGRFSLKYNALGDLAVFMNFGILGSLGAWVVQKGSVSAVPVLWAVPMSLLVIAILHANNWRDIGGDSEKGIITMASILGDRGSEVYYNFLIFSPFAITGIIITVTNLFPRLFPEMPLSFMIVLFALPTAFKLRAKAANRKRGNPLDFAALDGATAGLNLIFGLVSTAALIIHYFTGL